MTRPNAKRTGGPRTEAGKRVASENALTTGAYALVTLVLPGEDKEAFRQLKEQFINDFAPRDIAESAMVNDLASITWKKMRIDRLENSTVINELQRPFRKDEFPAGGGWTAEFANHWMAFKRGAETYEAAADVAKRLLKKQEALAMDDLVPVVNVHPLLIAALPHVVKALEDPLYLATSANPKLAASMGRAIERDFDRETRLALEAFESLVDELHRVQENPGPMETKLTQVRETRLLRFLEGHKGRRVQDDLDRSFYRTLGELRRHQAWRRMQSEITVQSD